MWVVVVDAAVTTETGAMDLDVWVDGVDVVSVVVGADETKVEVLGMAAIGLAMAVVMVVGAVRIQLRVCILYWSWSGTQSQF